MARKRIAAAVATTDALVPDDSRRVKRTSSLLMLALTAVLLTLLFPPFYCFFLAPVALVPFCVCVLRRPMRIGYLGLYYLLGTAFFASNLYWMAPVTIGGFIALALFVGLYFSLFALVLHRLVVHLRVPATVAVPLVWTAVEFIRSSFVLGGFPWFLLGNCLTPVPLLIQTADLFGVWGLTFLIALLNGYIVDVLRLPLRSEGRFSPAIRRLTLLTLMTLVATVGYGAYRLDEQTTRPGPRIAVIQENIPQSLKNRADASEDIFRRYLHLSDTAATTDPKPDLVAWPETMVPYYLNQEFQRVTAADLKAIGATPEGVKAVQEECQAVMQALQQRVDQLQVALLLGYGSLGPPVQTQNPVRQNRTVLLSPKAGGIDGNHPDEYSKVHIVPFGEMIPFRGVPVIRDLMMLMSPNGDDYTLTPGTEWTRFRLPVTQRWREEPPLTTQGSTGPATRATAVIETHTQFYTFGTPICFEDVMPEPARLMSAPQFAGGRKADFLLNVSNDGWFYGVELDQHLQACQIRAVENRIPIARSVNTGNSGFIDSNGRILILIGGARSIGAVGTASDVLRIDARVTLFSQVGDVLPIVCGIIGTALAGWTFVRPRRVATPAVRC